MDNKDLVRGLLALLTPETADYPERECSAPDHPMLGKYVIVRCRDAGVHAGVLVSASGREAVLTDSRRLWSFRVPMGKPAFLSGVAMYGVDGDSEDTKLGTPIDVALPETCEIILCTSAAEASIRSAKEHVRTR